MIVIYQHKETGQVVQVITVDDRHDMASVIIDGHHSTVVWSEFLKIHQPYLELEEGTDLTA